MSQPRRILIVDDDVTFGDLTQRRLTKLGYETKLHVGGTGALELTLWNRFDLVLVDVKMPGLGGQELAGLLQNTRGNAVKFLFFSSLDTQALRTLAKQCGAHGYISKSATAEELRFRIAEALGD